MKIFLQILFYIFCFSMLFSQQVHPIKLWYRQPAKSDINDIPNGWETDREWAKALPLGNGTLGAMVFGDVNTERIQLNEKSLWSGSPADNDNPKAFESLDKIRELLWEKKYKEATELTNKTQICKGVGSGNGNGANTAYGCFQTLGDLWIDFERSDSFENYHRELDLINGVVRVSYVQKGIQFLREAFISYPDNALIVRFTANKKGALRFAVSLTRPERFNCYNSNSQLVMNGKMSDGLGENGMKYVVRLKAITTGGKTFYMNKRIKIKNADEVLLILTASTNYKLHYPDYKGTDPFEKSAATLSNASGKKYSLLLSRHIHDFTLLSSACSLKLTGSESDMVPTDIRLQNQVQNSHDLFLQQAYFQYGRYLLISSSRKGALPANLQGIWANKIQTPWNGDYHTDINVQMNYWPADETNLSACYNPFTDLVESLVQPGKRTASVQYHANGWCVHPITNVWGFTAPGEQPGWGMHVGAGGWLCLQLWDHYNYTKDKKYLERIFPIMLQSAVFYMDWLVKDPATGKLVSGPATSPENSFIAPDGSISQISMGPSHDQEIIYSLFTNLLNAADVLGFRSDLLLRIKSAKNEIALPAIGSGGRLMEWSEDFKETEPAHRHASHLFMLYPGYPDNQEMNSAIYKATEKSLILRGDDGTGWSLAWKINFWARLKDGDHAYKILTRLIQPSENYKLNMGEAGGTYPNLFCAHPPFQIDGNFGATAGIAEMLLQSQDGYIELLPALPSAWKNGEAKGLVARGGFVVDMNWVNNQLVKAKIYARNGGFCKIKYSNKPTLEINMEKGKVYSIDSQLNHEFR